MKNNISLGNSNLKHIIGADGKNVGFYIDGKNLMSNESASFAFMQVGDKKLYPVDLSINDDIIKVSFDNTNTYEASFKIEVLDDAIIYELIDVKGKNVSYVSFLNINLDMKRHIDETDANGGITHEWNSKFDCSNDYINDNTLCACTLPLTLETQVKQMPLYGEKLIAYAFDCISMNNVKVAIVGGRYKDMKDKLKKLCKEKLEYEYSTAGGMYALEHELNRESYIIDTKGTLTVSTIDKWVKFLDRTGIKQYELHGGIPFRFGDVEFNEKIYKNKKEEIKQIIKVMHEKGFHVMLHTYGQCMDYKSSFVSPIPKGELTYNEVMTLSKDINEKDTEILVLESTEKMNTNTGFFFLNSLILRIGDELIKFNKVLKDGKYGFVECERGFADTYICNHKKGEKAYHLNQMFFNLCFYGDTEEFLDVARKTSQICNECGFDGIYFDAMDGMRMALHEEDRVADLHDEELNGCYEGTPLINYYRGRFLNEIIKNLDNDIMISGSGIGSHGYTVRSRTGAMDHANRVHKQYVDIHCTGNETGKKVSGYSQNIGWWAQVEANDLLQEETTYEDVYEYMLCKSIGGDYSLSFVNLLEEDIDKSPLYQRNVELMGRYEKLRLSDYFNDDVRKRLLAPGKEFKLSKNEKGEWGFNPVNWDEQIIYLNNDSEKQIEVTNEYEEQELAFRIIPLYNAGDYESAEAVEIFGVEDIDNYTKTEKGAHISVEKDVDETRGNCLSIKAKKIKDIRNAGACICTEYGEDLNLEDKGCTGAWIYGDGNGQLVNIQLRSPIHISPGFMERYIKIDFEGWKYFCFIENDSGKIGLKDIPDNFVYSIYRENVKWDEIHSVRVWMFGLPEDKEVSVKILPVKALPVLKPEIDKIDVTVNGVSVSFTKTVKPGEYLEYSNSEGFKHYLRNGELVNNIKVKISPVLKHGKNEISIKAENSLGKNTRAKICVFTKSNEWLSR